MFTAQTHNRRGYGRPASAVAFPDTCELENLGGPPPDRLHRVQPNGYSVKSFVDAYREEAKGADIKFQREEPAAYAKGFNPDSEWATIQAQNAKAIRVTRGIMDILAEEKMQDSMFKTPPAAVLPTGAAAQTAYADYSRITALFQRSDYGQLSTVENVQAVAKGVSKRTSTPLFSAFLAFIRQPPPPLAPQQQSKAMYIELVKRAVMLSNADTTWEEITGPIYGVPVADGIPVAQAAPADEKGGGFAAYDGFPVPGKP